MKMEVVMAFDSASTTPFISAPSSPQRTFFYSAPTSPTRISAFYHGGAIPFDWEEKPGIPKSHVSTAPSSTYGDAEDQQLDDFAFDFSGHLERHSLPADELFDGGKIKPLKPPPRFHYDQNKPLESPKSPKSPRKIAQAFSPRHRARDFDPFTAALEQTRKQSSTDERRGRERNTSNQPPASASRERNKGSSRSLSPFRVSDLLFDPVDTCNQEEDHDHDHDRQKKNNTTSLFSSSSFSSFWYKKWKIKDLLLFRSASESRAKELKKTSMSRQEEVKNSSFRSTDSVGSVSSRRRSGPPISAHELHYTVNRAFSEEMRKRTSLPYKQGLLGCLGFNPTVPHEISKGISPTVSLSRPSKFSD
ncbi:hypothetical protein C2S52_004545 [Perilla frutescens var. hirtella]|nr:hypothetical protein C2S51_011053 [Perilla frutescens var. frutescens]KAH6794068.1 hypothetical protein C2S52_004545 [Perilla frutescens var. hirtella]